MMQYEMGERHACRLLELSRSTYRYRVRNPERDKELRARLKELAAKRMRFGYRRLTVMLAREGSRRITNACIGCIARKDWRCAYDNGGGFSGMARWYDRRRSE